MIRNLLLHRSSILVVILFSSIILLNNRCGIDRPDCRLKFSNNSAITIKYMIVCNVLDTSQYYGSCYEGVVSPKTSKNECVDSSWENYFSNNEKLKIYLINKDTLDKIGIAKVFENRNFLKSLSFGKNEADNLNWTITYP